MKGNISWIQQKHDIDIVLSPETGKQRNYYQKQGNLEDVSDQKQVNMIWFKTMLDQKQS